MKTRLVTRTWVQRCWALACDGADQGDLVSKWRVPCRDEEQTVKPAKPHGDRPAPTPLLDWRPQAKPATPGAPPCEVDRFRRRAIRAGRPLRKFEAAIRDELDAQPAPDMPKTESECEARGWGESVPCPKVSCRHHLGIEVMRSGALRVIMPHWEDGAPENPPTCVLVEAAKGEHTAAQMGILLGIGANRIGQIEAIALSKLAARWGMHPDALRRALEAQRDIPEYK